MAVITDKSMIIDNQNDFKKAEREMSQIDISDVLGNILSNGVETGTSSKNKL